LAGLRDAWPELRERNASVAAISVDPAPESKLLRASLRLPFPLLSDADARVIAQWGVLMSRDQLAVPAVFVVEEGGTIVWRHVGETVPDRPTAQAVIEAIDGIAGLPSRGDHGR
jgi:peroxiredoxin